MLLRITLQIQSNMLFFSTVGTKESLDGGDKGEVSGRLKELLRYMNDTKSYPVEDSDNDLIKKIDAAVGEAKMDDEWRREYMMYQVRQRDAELRGEEKKARETAKSLYDMGLGVDKIVQAVSYPVEVVKQWLGLATVCN